jgi:type IV pilus assembly protein PilY1
MKPKLQFSFSLLALAGLLFSVASHATDIAELPLKVSVLSKPNVIFGFDDSSSMDFEVLFNGNDGAFWWDASSGSKSGWDSSGNLWFNSAGTSSIQWRKLVYLFPNGTNAGARLLTDTSYEHHAIPPTGQFGWTRSSAYNPLYYNPTVTYRPWSKAYLSGATKSYADATPTAAKSHPVQGSEVMDLTNNVALNMTANYTFMGLPGMKVPVGARTCDHTNCSSWSASVTAEYTIPSATTLRIAMAYFPATYYQKESCTYNGSSCVYAPDGTTTLKRYEIKPANYATTAAYNAAIQNFANWWQYYRKRKLMLSSAIGKVLEPLTGLRLGVYAFNSTSQQGPVTMYDTDAVSDSANGRKVVAGMFYGNTGSGGTPTRATLLYIGEQYRNTSGIIQYACQRNNAFIVTDGFAYATAIAPPSYSQAKWGTGAPYQTIFDYTLADIALSYYTINIKPSFATGQVPPNSTDSNTNLHMNTYALTLGAKGTLFVDDTTPVPTSPSAWPNPNVNYSPTAVDDLWHATINGRGKMYTATTPDETAVRIQTAMDDILTAKGAQSGVAVSTVNLMRGDGFAYVGNYNPAGWSGDLTANAVDSATGVISGTATWSASALLSARDWTTRNIASSNGSSGVVFNAAGVGSIVNPSGTWGTTADLMNHLRGDRSQEGTAFRTRTGLMGAVINSEPLISRDDNVVFVASGEGMLHAFDISAGSTRGKELWAFVPYAALGDMGQTAARGYSFKTQLDGTPVIGKVAGTGTKLLVAGMGVAGNAYYALDVTTPRTNSESNLSWVKWQFPGGSTASYASKVGQTLGRPLIVNTSAGYRVLVTSGYNSTADGKGRLFVLDPSDGSVKKEFATTAGTLANEAGLTNVSGYAEDDGTVRYVYGGDLLGNVWRFDLNAATGTAPNQVAQLTGPSGAAQPVTAAPELVSVGGQRVVLIGTGRLLDVTDFGNGNVQTFYAIADGTTLTNARASLTQRIYTRNTDTSGGATVDWTTGRGWYMDLPAGEQQNTRPAVAYGAVAFTTNVAGATDCTASSWFYVINFETGDKLAGAAFLSSQISTTVNVSGVNAVVTSTGDVRGLMQTYEGQPVQKTITPKPAITPTKNAWREVRPQ